MYANKHKKGLYLEPALVFSFFRMNGPLVSCFHLNAFYPGKKYNVCGRALMTEPVFILPYKHDK